MNPRVPLKGSFKGDVGIDIDVNIDADRYEYSYTYEIQRNILWTCQRSCSIYNEGPQNQTLRTKGFEEDLTVLKSYQGLLRAMTALLSGPPLPIGSLSQEDPASRRSKSFSLRNSRLLFRNLYVLSYHKQKEN